MNKLEILITGLNQIGLDYNQTQLDMLELYISEIELWNKKFKLVGAGGEDLIIRHVLDSLSAVPELKKLKVKTAADVGSGAGLPGIPLSVFFPDVHFSLIERSGRRAGFLRNILSLLNIANNVSIVESDLGEVKSEYDLVLFRAFRNLIDFYEPLLKIKSSEGYLFAYKGKIEIIESEISKLGNKIKVNIVKAFVPFLEEERNFCIFF
ncbi:MAG: 16S rRNA (guanine(527)-N(7))-methyltransferase RsmG [Spirochaetia bacterium]|jgi:16S rRNA (guanine527-N7)-methyltransferase|nr:16S rRNA (guanine(527)-N(7))-methyltransferase RsmG [Spirochaetia bacterium]